MKRLTLVFVILSGAFSMRSQTVTPTVISSNGGYFSSSQGSVAWTIGEPVSETYNATGNITTMGFHQPELVLVDMIKEQQGDQAILVYPNPVKEELSINFSGMNKGSYSLEIVDAAGKLIYHGNANITGNADRVSVRMNEVSGGTYFLNISGKDFNKIIKINKLN